MTKQQIAKIVLPSAFLKQDEYESLGCRAFDYKGFATLQSSWKTHDTVDFGTVLGTNAKWVKEKCAWILVQTPDQKQFMIPTNTNTHGATVAGGKARGAKQIWAQVLRGTTPVNTAVEGQVVGIPHVAGG